MYFEQTACLQTYIYSKNIGLNKSGFNPMHTQPVSHWAFVLMDKIPTSVTHKVPSSSHGQGTNYHHWGFLQCILVPPAKCQNITSKEATDTPLLILFNSLFGIILPSNAISLSCWQNP